MIALLAALLMFEHHALHIEGSSTVAPILAEALDEAGLYDADLHPNGTVVGFRRMCVDRAVNLVGASRRITEEERAACRENQVSDVAEIPLGQDGLVLAMTARNRALRMDLRELYLAAAFMVPEDDTCQLIPNPNRSWSDIDRSLPRRPIRFYGPPVGSGTRDMFVDLALAEGARQIDCLAELERRDPQAFTMAIVPRHDEAWFDAGENDAALSVALRYAHDAIGIFGWNAFEAAADLRAVTINGISPNRRTIVDGRYPLSRPLFLYATAESLTEPRVRRLLTTLQRGDEPGQVRRYSTDGDGISTIESTDPKRRVRRY